MPVNLVTCVHHGVCSSYPSSGKPYWSFERRFTLLVFGRLKREYARRILFQPNHNTIISFFLLSNSFVRIGMFATIILNNRLTCHERKSAPFPIVLSCPDMRSPLCGLKAATLIANCGSGGALFSLAKKNSATTQKCPGRNVIASVCVST